MESSNKLLKCDCAGRKKKHGFSTFQSKGAIG